MCVTGLKCLVPKPAGGGSVYTDVNTYLLVYSVQCIVRSMSYFVVHDNILYIHYSCS